MATILSPKLAMLKQEDGMVHWALAHWCPGCNHLHHIFVFQRELNRPHYDWNRNPGLPTITPTVEVSPRWGDGDMDVVCRYEVHEGVIEFMPECTHALAGQNVPLPDIPMNELHRLAPGVAKRILNERSRPSSKKLRRARLVK